MRKIWQLLYLAKRNTTLNSLSRLLEFSSKVITHRSWIVPRSIFLRNITSFSPGVQMKKIALLGSLEPIYGLLWLTFNEIGLRQNLKSCYIICIILLFMHSLIPVFWEGGRPKGLPKMTEYQSTPPCRFKASRGFSPQRVFCRFSEGDGGGGNGESGLFISA